MLTKPDNVSSSPLVAYEQLSRAYDHGENVGFEKGVQSDKFIKTQALNGNVHSLTEIMLAFCEKSSGVVEKIYALTKNYNSFELLIVIPEKVMFGEGFSELCSKETESQNDLMKMGIFLSCSYVELSDQLDYSAIASDGYDLLIKKTDRE
jgi:hypothetical protein